MKTIQKKRKGFTLAELVVVVTILGILAVIAVARFSKATESAKMRTFESNHRIMVSAITMYMADNNGSQPPAGTNLAPYLSQSSGTAATDVTSFNGKPEGSTYVYTYDTGTKTGKLTSTFQPAGGGAEKKLEYTP